MATRSIWQVLTAVVTVMLASCAEQAPRVSSAADNVHVLPEAFEMPGLERSRQIRIYLPPGYEQGDRRYPVLYMHDGQNLFDDVTSYAGEWGVDETLNELAGQEGPELIVVGIDNGQERRMNELSPWPNPEFGAAEGREYMTFIVDVVKPFVDRSYRTLPGQEHTAIMGSSMGGLISHYALFEYPQVFSRAGVFSPSYWYSDEVFSSSDVDRLADNSRLYLLIGAKEGGAAKDLRRMHEQLIDDGLNGERIVAKVVPGGWHHESFWRAHFGEAVEWLFRP